jgi:Na+:H+ antiporter, NhaA family
MSDKRLIRLPLGLPGGHRLPPVGTAFVSIEVASGLVLALATVAALVVANVAPDAYTDFWATELTIGPIDLDLTHWVNDGLMTLFFFVVGLEIKRELVVGDLRDRRTASLPVAAALGGMLVPAAIYAALNAGGEGEAGWAIPMATDIAFALAVLALVGDRVPRTLKLFLLTLAIVDDIGAILVIAVFYADHLEPVWLLGAAGTVVVIVALRQAGVARPVAYVLPAGVLWFCTQQSGVHATIAGVILGLLTPAEPVGGRPVLTDLEDRLHPWSSFLVVPLFAFANAGVRLGHDALEAAWSGAIGWGILLGLLVGKPLGILGASALAVRLRLGVLPQGVQLRELAGLGMIAGIGFTVSLFVADLSFEGVLLGEAKVAILVASIVAGGAGAVLVRLTADPD